MKGVAGFALMLIACAGVLRAQNAGAAAGTGFVALSTEPDSAAVWIDGIPAGTSPLRVYPLSPGIHTVKISAGDPRIWDAAFLVDSLRIIPGDTVRRVYRLPKSIRVMSIPAGASVFRGSALLGTSPCVVNIPFGMGRSFEVRAAGYPAHEIDSDTMAGVRSVVRLVPHQGAGAEVPPTAGDHSPSSFGTYKGVAAGTMVLSGVLAALWKNDANVEYDAWVVSGDPSRRDASRRFDVRAGAALAIANLGFVVLCTMLLAE